MVGSAIIFLIIASVSGLKIAPNAVGEPPTYRILYFHVPTAIMAYLGFFMVFVGSIGYLWKKNPMYDRWAVAGADLGVHFCALMLITGMIWGKQRWGAWWIWEPRLTSALILLIIFSGYLILRGVVENKVTQARYAAVYGIIGFLDVPLVHFAIKLWGSIMHPPKPAMDPMMKIALWISMFAFFFTFVVIYLMRLRYEKGKAELSRLKAEQDDG